MLINPVLLVLSAALVLLCVFYCIINRPNKPVLTLVFVILLILYIMCTLVLNNAITPDAEHVISPESWSRFASFIVAVKKPTPEQYENAFLVFQRIDVGLFIAAAGSMIWDVWNIVVKPGRKK